MHASVNYMSTLDVNFPWVQLLMFNIYTPFTLTSEFCEIEDFEVSTGVIGFSFMNRETLYEIGRAGSHEIYEKSRTDLCPKITQNVRKTLTKFIEVIHSRYFLKHVDHI